MKHLTRLIESPRFLLWLWFFVFTYSWLASLFLQLWLIPSLFTQPSAAEGLVVLDSLGFDRIAKAKAREIAIVGWSAWELRPAGLSPAGIASAFYALLGSSPLSMLPFNAVVHAFSACIVMVILRNFFALIPAFAGALVFTLNPASFEWVAQIHRDGVFCLGNLLILSAMLRIADEAETAKNKRLWDWVAMLGMSITGTLLIWVARPYWIQITLVSFVLAAMLITVVLLLRKSCNFKDNIPGLAMLVFAITAFQFSMIRFYSPQDPFYTPAFIASESNASESNASESNASESNASESNASESNASESKKFRLLWQRSFWLPDAIDNRFARIFTARQGAISQGGNTLVDADERINSVSNMFGYIPRALQVGLLSPFPQFWGGEGSTPAMTMARKVVGATTVFFYVCLLGYLYALIRMWKNIKLWILTGMCLIGIVLYALSYPNIGTLIRYRYGFYMLLIGFGVASWCDLWLRRPLYREKG